MATLGVALASAISAACLAGQPFLFNGRLTLDTTTALDIEVLRDDYKFVAVPHYKVNFLPPFDFQYVQDDNTLIPLQRGSIPSSHPMWEYILEPGRIWFDKNDPDLRKVSLPFTLQEYNANCMHNGTLNFSIDKDNDLSPVRVNIASETCMYFKFNLKVSLQANYDSSSPEQAATAVDQFQRQRAARLPIQPIAALSAKYPKVELSVFSGAGKIPIEDISAFGFVIDDIHYQGNCQTREGSYPFCADINLPSYSLAKTLLAGLAAMRLEKLYPGSRNAFIGDYIPQCRKSGNWQDVTFSQTLNMLSGNFGSGAGRDDETSPVTDELFFFKSSHTDKISYSCDAWPRNAPPGSRWVYHTTDTYLLGSAMNALLREKRDGKADIYNDLVLPLWQDLNLSPAVSVIRRTYDAEKQPFSGFGISLLPDDIARLATALNRDRFAGQLDQDMYNRAMQRLPEPQGSYPADGKYYYSNGFWAFNARELLDCKGPVMIPFMSGYGGINVVMMPNDSVYYIFGDSGKFAFADVIVQSHKIRSLCPTEE
jgi:hypothetical protein